jgi:hypothetical protein
LQDIEARGSTKGKSRNFIWRKVLPIPGFRSTVPQKFNIGTMLLFPFKNALEGTERQSDLADKSQQNLGGLSTIKKKIFASISCNHRCLEFRFVKAQKVAGVLIGLCFHDMFDYNPT